MSHVSVNVATSRTRLLAIVLFIINLRMRKSNSKASDSTAIGICMHTSTAFLISLDLIMTTTRPRVRAASGFVPVAAWAELGFWFARATTPIDIRRRRHWHAYVRRPAPSTDVWLLLRAALRIPNGGSLQDASKRERNHPMAAADDYTHPPATHTSIHELLQRTGPGPSTLT